MTNLSFDSYISKARENLDGTLRIAKGDEGKPQLVNKGTFGNKVATFFDNIGRGISSLFGGHGDTRVERNQKALEGFRKALVQKFGEGVGNEALRRSGLDRDGVELTGKKIIEVSDLALFKHTVNRSHNVERLKDCLPVDYGRDYVGGKFFGEICEKLGVSPDLARTLPPERYEAYSERLVSAFRERSGLHGRPLTEGESKEIATGVLKQVLKLDRVEGGLERAQQAREALKQSVMELIADVANGRSPRKLMESLGEFNRCLAAVKEAEAFEGEDQLAPLRDQVILEAMVELNSHDGEWLKQAQTSIFGEGSSFRALYATLQEAGTGGMDGVSEGGMKRAMTLSLLLGDLVGKLQQAVGAHTGDDRRQLEDTRNLSRRSLERTQQVVLPHLDTTGTARQFLEGLKRDFSGRDEESGLPDWHSSEVLKRLENEVVNHLTETHVLMEYACNDFRIVIERDPDLSQDLKDKLLAGLRALEAEAGLDHALLQHDEFKDLDPKQTWKLFMAGGDSKWELEQFNQGSLAGLQRGFEHMLGTRDQPLTSDYLERLQTRSTEGSFRSELKNSFSSHVFEDQKPEMVEDSRLEQGFREKYTNLDLKESEITREGLEALKAGQGRGYQLKEIEGGYQLYFPETTREESANRATAILDTYRDEIDRAGSPDDKLHAIAKAVQDLYCSHLFRDGNTRTVVVNLMNRMLLDNGLTPSVLSNPKVAATCSLDELVQFIKDGQETFQKLKQ